jgi:AraC-like DNA-binding protein
VTYREIVRSLRMRRGRELLVATAKPLAEVALRAGYSDPSNFHRAFLLQTGMSPGRFREALRSPATSHAE